MPIAVAGACATVIVTFPVFDCDLYWHLANGRAMTASGQIINREIFSFTHAGTHFTNHEWLAQIIFYWLWRLLGYPGLLALKMLAALVVTVTLFRLGRRAGTSDWTTCVLAVLGILAGMPRYQVRPEIFSLVGIAILTAILPMRPRLTDGRHLRWRLPALMLVWDWLHGALFGWVYLGIYTIAINLERSPSFARFSAQAPEMGSVPLRRNLNLGLAAALATSMANPYGVLTYGHFLTLAGGSEGARYIQELRPLWETPGEARPFLVLLSLALVMSGTGRKPGLPEMLLPVAFCAAAMRYERLVAVAAIVVVASLIGRASPAPRSFAGSCKPTAMHPDA